MTLLQIPTHIHNALQTVPTPPTADRIIDRDGLGWTRYTDMGWVPDGDAHPQPWETIQVWGPFTPDDLGGELS